MKRFAYLMAVGFGLALLAPHASFGDTYYVCWKKVRMEFRWCTRCFGPFLSQSPSIVNSRTQCPNEQGMDFNSRRDALDWMAPHCDCP